MATLDQAFIKAYTQARQSPAPTTADGAPAAPPASPPRIGPGALGLRSIGLTPRKPRASEPTAAPQAVVTVVAPTPANQRAERTSEQTSEQMAAPAPMLMGEQATAQVDETTKTIVFSSVARAVEKTPGPAFELAVEQPVIAVATPSEAPVAEFPVAAITVPIVAARAADSSAGRDADITLEPVTVAPEMVAVLPRTTSAVSTEAVSSEAKRAAMDFVPTTDDSEPFAVSLATPLVPELILAESLAVEPTVYYCEPAEATVAPDQSDLLVWHPTTRDFIVSESDLVVVPRFAPQIQVASDTSTSVATIEERRSPGRAAASEESFASEQCSAQTETPTNRAVVVPPPLPKTLIPPAPETGPEAEPVVSQSTSSMDSVAVTAPPTGETAQVKPAIDEAAAVETAAVEAATIAAAIGKPAFAPLSSFNPRLVGEVLRPQLEVDRFAWPEVCGLLLGRVEADFIRLAVELTVRLNDTNQIVAWTGCRRGEGRTTSLLCMAQRLSALGQRCVLVDADFSRPELARRLGISAQVGWEEIVAGNAQLSDVLIGSIEDKIALLPRRQKCVAGTHPGAGPRATALFGMLREAFDVVLLDVGPMAGEAELADMSSCAEAANVGGAYLVFDSRNTTKADMAATAESLRSSGIKVWGAIENFRH